jgi:hypothetical protein
MEQKPVSCVFAREQRTLVQRHTEPYKHLAIAAAHLNYG